MANVLLAQGIVPGIKVDKGVKPVLSGNALETVTQGMDDLDVRCKDYYAKGARFAKWRGVLHISDDTGLTPSRLAMEENANTLARYAQICQANGLVPIVEPEVLMDGSFSIEHSAKCTEKVLSYVFRALQEHNVLLEGCILKPNMVRSGVDFVPKAKPNEIAKHTVQTLRNTAPPSLGGVTFLSGGMSELEASESLNLINNESGGKNPWTLTFSYGRALQESVLNAWKGKDENRGAAQKMLLHRAECNGMASLGEYKGEENVGVAGKSMHEKGYVY